MVKKITREQAKQKPLRLRRFVNSYKKKLPGKVVEVREYTQGYASPRGPITRVAADRLKRKSQTMWLMDRYGHFLGRANYEGKTAAKGVSKFGYDTTTVVRDAKKYKRIFGRTPIPRSRTYSY